MSFKPAIVLTILNTEMPRTKVKKVVSTAEKEKAQANKEYMERIDEYCKCFAVLFFFC